ncbi:MAG: hypothetical protein K9M45_00335 [Kiritimatiellales bacterium]|nr:hypothetical protein [Kiritimatiellales bacterium]
MLSLPEIQKGGLYPLEKKFHTLQIPMEFSMPDAKIQQRKKSTVKAGGKTTVPENNGS